MIMDKKTESIFVCNNCKTLMWENELFIEGKEKKCCCCAEGVTEYIAMPKTIENTSVNISEIIDLTESSNFLVENSKAVMKQVQGLIKDKIEYAESAAAIKQLFDNGGEFEILSERDQYIYGEVVKMLKKIS